MTERVDLLEARVAALSATIGALEARVAGLERWRGGATPEAAEEEPLPTGAPAPAEAAGAAPAALAGLAFLGIGGGYLFRALTEAEAFPHVVGVGLGLAYAGAWLLAAERSGGRGRRAEATLYGFLALAVGMPLLWEATARLHVLSPLGAAAFLAALGATTFAVAWRHGLASLAWAATLGAVGMAWGLLLATTRIELFTLLLVGFGAATLWTTYGRRWHGLRWPPALAADLAVLALVFLCGRTGGPPEAYSELSAGRGVFVALLLFVVYAGSFAARTLARRRDVNVFEVFQTAAVLVAGYGGAVRLSQEAGTGRAALGIAALALSAGAYAAAFGFVQRGADGARNFHFFSSLGLVLALTGGGILAEGPALALVWTAFGVAAAVLGARHGRRSLSAHGAVYLAAASIPSGLFEAARSAFASPVSEVPLRPAPAAAALAVAAAIAWVVAARRRLAGAAPVPEAAFLTVAAAGAGVGAILLLAASLPAGTTAPARTAVLAVAAVALAALRTRTNAEEAGWLAWMALAGAALRVLLQDLPGGRPVPLFVGFVLCGASLLALSRLRTRGATKPA